jgi:hypothetical protein
MITEPQYRRLISIYSRTGVVSRRVERMLQDSALPPGTTLAADDRLVRRSTILEFSGESVRAKAAKDRCH